MNPTGSIKDRMIREMLEDAELRFKMGQAAWSCVRERFSLDKFVKNTETVYKECLSVVHR